MIVYHGSSVAVPSPDVYHSRDNVDFGKGFYLTLLKEQAEKWLDFITTCRNVADKSTYDLVIGGVANDKVFNTIELYFDGLIEKKEAIKRLRYMEPNQQICIRRQEIIEKYLRFVESEEV